MILVSPIEYPSHGLTWCRVCGTFVWNEHDRGDDTRCAKHLQRNPCAIEGCHRSKTVPASRVLANDQWICAEHWRAFVPPRGPERRLYRIWNRIVSRARARAAGDLDVREINKLMGWDE